MSEFLQEQVMDTGDIFDNDFQKESSLPDYTYDVPVLDVNSFSRQDVFSHQDPLKYANAYHTPAFEMNIGGSHFVEPHAVDGYTRQDGTAVEGYYRDGDGNTSIDRTETQGGGYFRNNS